MYTEEVWIGSNSVGPFVWVSSCVLVHFVACDARLDETDSFIAIPHEQDGLGAPSLFAGTSACIQKRSGLVPTVSVLSFGLLNVFWSILHMDAHGWTKRTALLQFLMNEMDCDLPSCLRVLRHVYRRGLDWFQQCRSFRLGYSCVLVHFVAWMRTAGRNGQLYCDSS